MDLTVKDHLIHTSRVRLCMEEGLPELACLVRALLLFGCEFTLLLDG